MKTVAALGILAGMTFILPGPGGWTTITPGARNGGIQQYQVLPGPGEVLPNGARMAPTYPQTVPQYRAVPVYPTAPFGDGDLDDDDE
jgi:hypothetical protein